MPQRGQYGATRWSSTSRPLSAICLRLHQTLCDVGRVHRPVGRATCRPSSPSASVSRSNSSTWRSTLSRQRALNSATPYASMSCLPVKPSSFSTASSTGRPWQSQPARRGHVPALHGLEAREQVLEDPGLDVVHAGLAVGGRRALVEHPRLAAGGLLQAARRRPCRPPSGRARRARARAGRPGRAAGASGSSVVSAPVCHGVTACSTEGRGRGPRGTTLLGARGPPLLPCPAVTARRAGGADVHGRAGPRARTVPGSLLAAHAATGPRQRSAARVARERGTYARPGAATTRRGSVAEPVTDRGVPADPAPDAAPAPSAPRRAGPACWLPSRRWCSRRTWSPSTWSSRELEGRRVVSLLGGHLLLRVSRNPGAAFSFAEGATVVFTAGRRGGDRLHRAHGAPAAVARPGRSRWGCCSAAPPATSSTGCSARPAWVAARSSTSSTSSSGRPSTWPTAASSAGHPRGRPVAARRRRRRHPQGRRRAGRRLT